MSHDRNEFEDLETLLRRLPLAQPSAGLDSSIRRLTRGPSRRLAIAFIGAGLAAAAALLIALWPAAPDRSTSLTQNASSTTANVPRISTTEQWQDEGIVGYAANGPIRQYRIQSVQELASAKTSTMYLYQEQVVQVVSEAY